MNVFKLPLILIVLAVSLRAQCSLSINPLTAKLDCNGPPHGSGASLPSTCTVGAVYFRTASTIGLYQCTATDTWTVLSTGSATTPGGSSGQVQYNSGTATFAGDSGLAYNSSTKSLGVIGTIVTGQSGTQTGQVSFNGTTSGTTILKSADAATGTLTLPASTGTLAITTGNVATATALAANGANCSAGQFPLGVDASGVVESCTALPTTIAGTTNQIAASGSTGAITLSIPSSPTLPGTTTGTFSGNLTGNVTGNVSGTAGSATGNAATATALAANGGNCSAGQFPLGVDASGAVESCTALPTTIAGTSNEITASASTGAVTLSIPAPLRTKTCTVIIGDPGASSSALADDNDSPVGCQNEWGVDWTITTVACWANAGSPTVTPILTAGTGTSILTGALTCGTASWAAGTVQGTAPVVHSFSGTGATCSSTPCTIDVNITTAGGTAKYVAVKITGTLP